MSGFVQSMIISLIVSDKFSQVDWYPLIFCWMDKYSCSLSWQFAFNRKEVTKFIHRDYKMMDKLKVVNNNDYVKIDEIIIINDDGYHLVLSISCQC